MIPIMLLERTKAWLAKKLDYADDDAMLAKHAEELCALMLPYVRQHEAEQPSSETAAYANLAEAQVLKKGETKTSTLIDSAFKQFWDMWYGKYRGNMPVDAVATLIEDCKKTVRCEIPVVDEVEVIRTIAKAIEDFDSDVSDDLDECNIQQAIALRLRPFLKRELVARPASEWHEDMGPVLWWTSPITEPPYCGTPLDSDFPTISGEPYMKHWTPIQIPTTCIEDGSANA